MRLIKSYSFVPVFRSSVIPVIVSLNGHSIVILIQFEFTIVVFPSCVLFQTPKTKGVWPRKHASHTLHSISHLFVSNLSPIHGDETCSFWKSKF